LHNNDSELNDRKFATNDRVMHSISKCCTAISQTKLLWLSTA